MNPKKKKNLTPQQIEALRVARKAAKETLEKAQKEAAAAGLDDDDEEGDGDEDDLDKGAFTEGLDNLEKSLAGLASANKRTPSRREELAEAAKTRRLTEGERAEFDALVDGRPLGRRIEQSDELVKAMDMSPAFDVLGSHVSTAVDGLNQTLEKSMASIDAKFSAIAHAQLAQGEIVRQLALENNRLQKSLDEVLDQPARGPRAEVLPTAGVRDRATVIPLPAPKRGEPKPGEGGEGDDTIAPRVLKKVLEAMHGESLQKSMGGQSRNGLSIRGELSRVSSGQQPSPAMLTEIRSFLKANPAYAE